VKHLLVDRVLPALDKVGSVLAIVAMVMIVALIGVMLLEVISRYVFNAPTIWAIDITYMTNGSLFLIGAAYTLRRDAHVRIDFLSSRLPKRFQHAINLAFYLFLFLPVMAAVTESSWAKAWRAFERGTLENMSTWEPLIWPFLAGITLGVAGLTLQILIESIRHAIGLVDPAAVTLPGEGAGAAPPERQDAEAGRQAS